MNTIVLSKETKLGKEFTYYLSNVTKDESDLIENINDKDLANKELRKLVKNENAILIGVGDGMKLPAYKIESILGKISNGDYRCYDMPIEQQENVKSLVHVCESSETCWQSALRKVGYKGASGLRTPAYYTAYQLIWKTINQ